MFLIEDRQMIQSQSKFNLKINGKINVTYNYPLETITAENNIGFLDILLPESMILYNNKVFLPNDYVSSNMLILSQVLHKKLANDKYLYKNHNNLIKMLRKITLEMYDNSCYDITNRNIL